MLNNYLKNLKSFLTILNFKRMISNSKIPPNILIFTDNEIEFKKLKNFFLSLLGTNSYTIYNLTTKDFQKSSTWIPSCVLLITLETFNSPHSVLNEKTESFKKFIKSGGRILSLPTLNDNLERQHLKVDNRYNIFYHKENFLFESLYENCMKKEWKNIPKNLKDLFYIYELTDSEGSHFVSKVRFNIKNYSRLLNKFN